MRKKSEIFALVALVLVFAVACGAIYFAGRTTEASFLVSTARDPVESAAETSREPVDLNSADVAELQTLPGIGPTRAEAIVAYRETVGAFESKADILLIEGIGEGIYSQIENHITTGEENE